MPYPTQDEELDLPIATLTEEEEEEIDKAVLLAHEGKTRASRQILLPILETICENGQESPPKLEEAYARILEIESAK